jgi:hypothetical protein
LNLNNEVFGFYQRLSKETTKKPQRHRGTEKSLFFSVPQVAPCLLIAMR